MKISEFRKLIREEIRNIVSESSTDTESEKHYTLKYKDGKIKKVFSTYLDAKNKAEKTKAITIEDENGLLIWATANLNQIINSLHR